MALSVQKTKSVPKLVHGETGQQEMHIENKHRQQSDGNTVQSSLNFTLKQGN